MSAHDAPARPRSKDGASPVGTWFERDTQWLYRLLRRTLRLPAAEVEDTCATHTDIIKCGVALGTVKTGNEQLRGQAIVENPAGINMRRLVLMLARWEVAARMNQDIDIFREAMDQAISLG